MLWEIDIYPRPGEPSRLAKQVESDAAELGIAAGLKVTAAAGYLLQGRIDREQVDRLARELFADRVVEHPIVGSPGDADCALLPSPAPFWFTSSPSPA